MAKKINLLLPPPSFCEAKAKVKKRTKFSSLSLRLGVLKRRRKKPPNFPSKSRFQAEHEPVQGVDAPAYLRVKCSIGVESRE